MQPQGNPSAQEPQSTSTRANLRRSMKEQSCDEKEEEEEAEDEEDTEEEEEEEEEDSDGWTESHRQALLTAYNTLNPAAPNFWRAVSHTVAGKSASECQRKLEKRFPTPKAKASKASRSTRGGSTAGEPEEANLEQLVSQLPPRGRAPVKRKKILRKMLERSQRDQPADDVFASPSFSRAALLSSASASDHRGGGGDDTHLAASLQALSQADAAWDAWLSQDMPVLPAPLAPASATTSSGRSPADASPSSLSTPSTDANTPHTPFTAAVPSPFAPGSQSSNPVTPFSSSSALPQSALLTPFQRAPSREETEAYVNRLKKKGWGMHGLGLGAKRHTARPAPPAAAAGPRKRLRTAAESASEAAALFSKLEKTERSLAARRQRRYELPDDSGEEEAGGPDYYFSNASSDDDT